VKRAKNFEYKYIDKIYLAPDAAKISAHSFGSRRRICTVENRKNDQSVL
jgi:hypothetical protein